MCHLSDDPSDLIDPRLLAPRPAEMVPASTTNHLFKLPAYLNLDYRGSLLSFTGDESGRWRVTVADSKTVYYKSEPVTSIGNALSLAVAAVLFRIKA